MSSYGTSYGGGTTVWYAKLIARLNANSLFGDDPKSIYVIHQTYYPETVTNLASIAKGKVGVGVLSWGFANSVMISECMIMRGGMLSCSKLLYHMRTPGISCNCSAQRGFFFWRCRD